MIIGANSYRWAQHYERQSPPSLVEQNVDEALGYAAAGGIETWEPCWDSLDKFDIYAKALPKHGLQMKSVYVPCNLMLPDNNPEIGRVIALCLAAKELGCQLAVTNPDPVHWNNTPKPDDLIRYQTASLETLGYELRLRGIDLGYHFHTSELLDGAKELHHTMQHTTPDNVKLCLDSHWAYRGCGNSHLALQDLVHMYGSRIVSLHIRQSQNGIWTQTLCDGDINYQFLFDYLDARNWDGISCIELAIEAGTPVTMDLGQAHQISRSWLESAWPKARKGQTDHQR